MNRSFSSVLLTFAVLITAVACSQGRCEDVYNQTQNVSFSYELRSSANPGGSKPNSDGSEYEWGTVHTSGDRVQLYRHSFTPSPSESTTFEIIEYEAFAIDPHTLVYGEIALKQEAGRPPSSIKEARSIAAKAFAGNAHGSRNHYFRKTESAKDYVLRGFYFLGMSPHGQISDLANPQPGNGDGRTVFVYQADDLTEYRYGYDSTLQIYTFYSITSKSPSGDTVYTINGGMDERTAASDNLIFRTIVTHNLENAEPSVVETLLSVVDLDLHSTSRMEMQLIPREAARVDSLDQPQIRYEWQGGQIKKSVDELISAEGAFETSRRRRTWLLGINVAIVVIVLLLLLLRKWTKLAVILFAATMAAASEVRADGPYCGVNAVTWAAESLGVQVDREKLIDPEYITSQQGSSGNDLVKAAEHLGLKAVLVTGLGRDSLYAAESPLILHAAALGSHNDYNHWILFLGLEGTDHAKIVDGRGGIAKCTVEEVLARWDGVAIVVRTPSMSKSRLLTSELGSLLAYCSISGVAAAILGLSGSYVRFGRSGARLMVGLSFIVLVCFLLGYAGRGSGFDKTIAGMNSAMGLTKHRTLNSRVEVVELLQQGALLVDCRYESDYAAGTIQNATSIPVDVGLGELKAMADRLDRQRTLIIFCQSEKCMFSNYMCTLLAGEGFANICIYKGGYVGWINEVPAG